MIWIESAVALVAAIVVLIVVSFSKRHAGVDALGSLSASWIAEHRVDLP